MSIYIYTYIYIYIYVYMLIYIYIHTARGHTVEGWNLTILRARFQDWDTCGSDSLTQTQSTRQHGLRRIPSTSQGL